MAVPWACSILCEALYVGNQLANHLKAVFFVQVAFHFRHKQRDVKALVPAKRSKNKQKEMNSIFLLYAWHQLQIENQKHFQLFTDSNLQNNLSENKGIVIVHRIQSISRYDTCSMFFSYRICRKTIHFTLYVSSNFSVTQKMTWYNLKKSLSLFIFYSCLISNNKTLENSRTWQLRWKCYFETLE